MIQTLFFLNCILVVIIDPGIKTENGYSPYEDGLKMDIFVKVIIIEFFHLFIV